DTDTPHTYTLSLTTLFRSTFDELRPVADAMEKGGRKAAAKAVTDEILRKVFPIAGTPEECIQRIEEYREAGCTHIMLEIWGDDRDRKSTRLNSSHVAISYA